MIEIEALDVDYAGPARGETAVRAVRGVSLTVAAGEFFTLLGPSGCGKTSTLRAVAGLERPSGGRIRIDGQTVYDAATGIEVPTPKRPISMVFQSYAVWPHLSVQDNVAFPLEVAGLARAEARRKIAPVLERVGLAALAERSATQLSGGQQQRVAIARALAREVPVMLLDEPLSNLDAKLREQMRIELRRLIKQSGLAAIYVTHDQDEALMLSDRIAVMNEGRVVECGTPVDLYQRPTRRFSAAFLGSALIWPVLARDADAVVTPIGALRVEAGFDRAAAHVAIRPEAIRLVTDPSSAAQGSRLPGRIVRSAFAGRVAHYEVACRDGEPPLPVIALPQPLLAEGVGVMLELPAAALIGLKGE
jgi:iron(III) transport system ATP-binding protein